MSYTAITSAQIVTGEPTSQELFSAVKGNFEDHEARLLSVENATGAVQPLLLTVNGNYSGFGAKTNVLVYRVPYGITVLAARLMIITAGASGTTEIDLQYKRGGAAFATLFSTRPSVGYAAGDLAISTNQILSVTALQAGDILRLDTTAVQTSAKGYQVIIEYQVT